MSRGGAALKNHQSMGEVVMVHTNVHYRLLEEMDEAARLGRLRHILEILEAEDGTHFDFYAHRHPEMSGRRSMTHQ